MKQYLGWLYEQALNLNDQNVADALAKTGPHKVLLDVGCWDGIKTQELAAAAKAETLLGIEPIKSAAKDAEKRGVKTYTVQADREKWPINDESVDCVVSNQVVEHLSDLDFFFSEAARVLKPGGYIISSTNNLSSWHNIGALLFGWAPFDFTNSSSKTKGIGNPLAIHRGETDERGSSWTHKCIYTAQWLNEWQELYGLKSKEVLGAGYHPLPPIIGKYFTRHCAFITVIARKSRHGK